MSEDKVESIRSISSGTVGRAVNRARSHELVLDSSSHPQADAFTNGEAFLGGISSCGVTLIEGYAQQENISLERMAVSIEGVRPASDLARFDRISMHFELAGVSQAQADELVQVWRER